MGRAPNLSETCGVAGVRLDRGRPERIRTYPVKFRNADFDSKHTNGSQQSGEAHRLPRGWVTGRPTRKGTFMLRVAVPLSFGLCVLWPEVRPEGL
jgi:hypothetical protein